ncbi:MULTISPECIES: hypothetical protein [unclassified Methanoculleus]|uniref:hypothetical protein n=1 Tax=unclassified Methanoculleus TaxID=2619537 RepID=UPI0025ECB6E2|nr:MULTISPECIES: hypothetical protein [unclassified Methanoculleus]MCK9317441.1 hypothetical protein [Methanoculleus sp.]MDD2254068.1 hypothetical protein [Methanoculleus sp.]MDD2788305.1 hypothetical protein [Methanoculleus sp.]MDD3215373.1 hypothetical protein [Methanoculleus sp.]MDD4314302.1 hypothetical protein [Methanoculleus sp.]
MEDDSTKRRSVTWLFLSLSAALLAALLLLHAPGAGAVHDPVEMPAPTKEPGRAGNLTIILVTRDSKLPQAVPIPSSWRDIEPEKCEPSEEDWAFIRDAATNLSEEEKTRFVTEVREIYAGVSTLSQGEQDDLERRLGYYLIKATERAGTAP